MSAAILGSRVWIDGVVKKVEQAQIGLTDRGFSLGDGLFETMLWTGTEVQFFPDHMARLSHAAMALEIELPFAVQDIHTGLLDLAKDAGPRRAALRLTLTRGSGPRGLAFPAPTQPRLIATIAPNARPDTPAKLVTVDIARNCGAPTARFKTLSYLDNVMALNQARARGGDEAMMPASNGAIACASSANLVIFYQGQSLTPPIDDGALPGIVRGRLLRAGLIQEASISPDMLTKCEHAALTNALIGVRPVSAIDGREVSLNTDWRALLASAIGA